MKLTLQATAFVMIATIVSVVLLFTAIEWLGVGDVFKFVQEMKKLEFTEAVEKVDEA